MTRIGLVIDDDIPSRKIYASLLRSLGFEVTEAGDGVEAMAVLQNGQPRIVFLDIRLPKVDGLQILHYIYDSAHLSDTRVFIITAHKDYADTISLRNGDMYLLKPIAPSEIRDIVSQALIQP